LESVENSVPGRSDGAAVELPGGSCRKIQDVAALARQADTRMAQRGDIDRPSVEETVIA
jgi:hypothetical protein